MDSMRTDHDTTGYCGFVVGQHVVCVDDESTPKYGLRGYLYVGGLDGLKAQRVYTLRSVFICPRHNTVCVRLQEITRSEMPGFPGEEAGFDARRFRPLQKLTPEQFMQTDAPVEGREVAA